MNPLVSAIISHGLQRAFGPDDEPEHDDEGPRCAVCGGPFEDGSGCEFCPKAGS